jgi:hypothetical protein
MPYTAPTLATAITALASRLHDPAHVHWLEAELSAYIREALRTWNAWTAHWRDQGAFDTVIAQPFYDLPTELPTLRGYTLTNWALVSDIQYALMEPAAPGGTWTGTDQFTLEQISGAIQASRDQFLTETGAVLTRSVTTYAAPPASGRIALDESVVSVRRAAWRPTATALLRPLMRTDEWAGTHYQVSWGTSTQPPSAYSVSVTPPLELQLMPKPAAGGDLDLVAIQMGATIDPLVETALGIPDDFAWVVKYGALAELLSNDGLAYDPLRAAYCQQRWEAGIDMARSAAVVLNVQIGTEAGGTLPVTTSGLSAADTYSPLWQLLTGVPRLVLLAGQNLMAMAAPPGGGGPYTVTCDVVRNAPVPTDPTDILQVSQDLYESVLNIAQHLALFKQGVGELELATSLLERAAKDAGIDLQLQQAAQPDRTGAFGQQQADRRSWAEQRTPIPVPVEG